MKMFHFDTETIPVQSEALRADLAQVHTDALVQTIAGIDSEIVNLKPPGNLKKQETIDEWIANQKPKKIEELHASKTIASKASLDKIEFDWRRTSLDGALGQIVVIGFAIDDAAPAMIFEKDPKKCLTLAAEAVVLREFFAWLEKHVPQKHQYSMVWSGHNIIDFDLRFIFQRAVIHGIRPPSWIPFNAKPWGDRVFDTMKAWAGDRGRISQDKLCRVLGISAKGSELGDDIDGSKVWDFVKDGRIADVATYCGGDVGRAREIHQRLTFGGA